MSGAGGGDPASHYPRYLCVICATQLKAPFIKLCSHGDVICWIVTPLFAMESPRDLRRFKAVFPKLVKVQSDPRPDNAAILELIFDYRDAYNKHRSIRSDPLATWIYARLILGTIAKVIDFTAPVRARRAFSEEDNDRRRCG